MFLSLALVAALGTGASTPTNTICPVLGDKVTPGKSSTVEVRGRSYYLCCPGCGPKLKADPDRYLMKDGTPKNAKSNSHKNAGSSHH